MDESSADRSARQDREGDGREDGEEEYRPLGAILITTFLAIVIVLGWFGVFFLDFLRG